MQEIFANLRKLAKFTKISCTWKFAVLQYFAQNITERLTSFTDHPSQFDFYRPPVCPSICGCYNYRPRIRDHEAREILHLVASIRPYWHGVVDIGTWLCQAKGPVKHKSATLIIECSSQGAFKMAGHSKWLLFWQVAPSRSITLLISSYGYCDTIFIGCLVGSTEPTLCTTTLVHSYLVDCGAALCTTKTFIHMHVMHKGIVYSIFTFVNEHANQDSQCSSVPTYTLVVHNVALYRLGGAQDDFACPLSTFLMVYNAVLNVLLWLSYLHNLINYFHLTIDYWVTSNFWPYLPINGCDFWAW